MHNLLLQLEQQFNASADEQIARQQEAYVKYNFKFLGLTTPIRTTLEKPIFRQIKLNDTQDLVKIISHLWDKPYREFQHSAIVFARKHKKLYSPELLTAFEHLIRTHSWWDTVDAISSNLVGELIMRYPELINTMDVWIDDSNMWIRRCALIFQLKYKQKTDIGRLFSYCKKTMHENDFFIRKAIGWALRELSKTNASAVQQFVEEHKDSLSNLSKREACKYL